MSFPRLAWLSLLVAGAAGGAILVDRCVDRLTATTGPTPLTAPAPRPAGSSGGAPSAATTSEPQVTFFDGGYAVGPARAIEKVLAAQTRGTPTACEQPPPTPEERAQWKGVKSDLSSVPLVDLLRRTDLDLVTEVGSRLLDKKYGPGFASMSRPEQNVYLVWVLQGEVVDGGLDQFFGNSSGNCAVRTAAALDEIGLVQESKVYRDALALFPDASPSEDRSTRYDQLDAIGARRARWDSMDRKLYNVLQGAAGYIRGNALAFDLRP
jgi:hypothetical protein